MKHKEANRRKDALRQLSRSLVDDHDVIVHERLKVSNMSRYGEPLLEDVQSVRGVVDEVDALSSRLNRQAEECSSPRRRA